MSLPANEIMNCYKMILCSYIKHEFPFSQSTSLQHTMGSRTLTTLVEGSTITPDKANEICASLEATPSTGDKRDILFNYCTHTARSRQRASALPRAKIEVSSICDADRAASPASPISSLVKCPHW
jgi:hypothetical protein